MKRKIEKILIPTDYSPNAKRATEFGLDLASKLNAEVFLFHSFHIAVPTSEAMMHIPELEKEQNSKLIQEKDFFKVQFPDLNLSTIVNYGSAVDNIESICEKEGIDLIVMGTKGETNGIDAVLGSVASNTVNHTQCSTLVIPSETRSLNIKEVVYATDFDKTENKDYLSTLLRILDATSAAVSIVNVNPDFDSPEARTVAEEQTSTIFGAYKHSYHFVSADDDEEGLYNFASQHDADLIAILTKHYSLWERLWKKSLAREMVLHSTLPLLIMHQDD